MAAGAPYFHHGEARTLEEVFSSRYAAHHQAGNANFLANGGTTPAEQAEIRQLVAFLKSIDESTQTFPVQANEDICVNY
jgi:cytochrome c peroxidase